MSIGHFYLQSLSKIFSGDISFSTDTFYCSLHTSAYAYDQMNDEFFSVVTNEITGTGYTAGGVLVSGITTNTDTGSGVFSIDIDDPFWALLTATGIRIGVIRKDTGNPATDPLIALLELGVDDSPSGADYSLVVPTEGLIAVGVS